MNAGNSQGLSSPLRVGKTEIRTIYDLLGLIRVRPGMWLGTASVTCLQVFLVGFSTGIDAGNS